MWLINTHNGVKEKRLKPIDINDYPAIKKHLNKYFERLDKRVDKGDTPYNLRNCAYMEDFYKPKLLWAETMRIHKKKDVKFPRFGYDHRGDYLVDKTCFFATGRDIKYILAVLNSSFGKYLCSQYVSILDNGGYLMQKIFLEKIPIPNLHTQIEIEIEEIINNPSDTDETREQQIDNIIFNLYNLDEAEVNYVNSEYI